MKYRRAYQPGASYFFTLVTRQRLPIFAKPTRISELRDAIRQVKTRHPFELDAMVILPDHLHCIWTLEEGETDFSTRWRLIKTRFTKQSGLANPWQPRFWEHLIRDQRDYNQHLDYIHYNPVKHGYVQAAGQWQYSSFDRYVASGVYPADWGSSEPEIDKLIGRE